MAVRASGKDIYVPAKTTVATLAVAVFLLLAVYGRNPALMAVVIILGIGLIGIHLMHRKETAAG